MKRDEFYLRACESIANALIKACLADMATKDDLVRVTRDVKDGKVHSSHEMSADAFAACMNLMTRACHLAGHLTDEAERCCDLFMEEETPFDQ